MFNPFYPFTRQLLEGFLKKGKRYFVRQTFNRGKDYFDETTKACFLFSAYDQFTTAQDHFGAIEYDPNRFLYDWEDPGHRERLQKATEGVKEYKLFAGVFRPDWEEHLTDRLQEKMRAYVAGLGWTPKKADKVSSNFELQFGELFIRIKYGGRQAKIKFEEIEKLA